MRLLKRPSQHLLAAAMRWLMGAVCVATTASVWAQGCYPRWAEPPVSSNNRPIYPAPGLSQLADPWGDPGAPRMEGRFPCSGQTSCTLPQVLQEASACALLVIQHGRLVYEYYEAANQYCSEEGTQPNGRAKLYGLKSVTKSVVSTLLGQMVSDPSRFGALALDDPVSRHVGGLPVGSHLSQVSLRQALTMTSALAFSEDANCLEAWTSDNPRELGSAAPASGKTFLQAVSRYPNQNLRQRPGKDFYYAGINTALVGLTVESLLSKLPGDGPRHLDKALQAWLWQSAGMRDEARWKADKADTPNPYCCLFATARDLGRFGQYILNNWKAGGPGAPLHGWIREATTTQVWPDKRSCPINGQDVRIGYGYQWWTLSGSEGFTALGFNGQFLHVMPDRDTVIVQFGSWPQGGGRNTAWPDRTECRVYAAHRFLADRDWP